MENIRTSPKKARKPQAKTLLLRKTIATITAEFERMSVRQLYYQLVTRRIIEKTEATYKQVCDISAQMRLDGSLDYRKITDGHRQRRETSQYSNMSEALNQMHNFYRHNYWITQPTRVEIWCEKDALTGVIQPKCSEYGVPYVATKGFPSITLIYESAQEMKDNHKPTNIYYFGDHDPSGRMISQNLEAQLRAHGADVTVKRMALEPSQINYYDLPTRPGKTTDSRYIKFAGRYGDACVELDALPPNVLTALVTRCIVENIDRELWYKTQEIEAAERATLKSISHINFVPGLNYTMKNEPEGATDGV